MVSNEFTGGYADGQGVAHFDEWLKKSSHAAEIWKECQAMTAEEREAEIQRLNAILDQKETWYSTVEHISALVFKYLALIAIQISPIVAEVTYIAINDNLMYGALAGVAAAFWSYLTTKLLFTELKLE